MGIFTNMMNDKYFKRAIKRFLDAEEMTRVDCSDTTWREYYEARKVLEAWKK